MEKVKLPRNLTDEEIKENSERIHYFTNLCILHDPKFAASYSELQAKFDQSIAMANAKLPRTARLVRQGRKKLV
jgi:hypothetical protein